MTTVNRGDIVSIHYTGRLTDGHVFDSSREGDPLQFTAGSQELIPGVSEAVIGMSQGDSKEVNVSPEQGYGPRVPELEQTVQRSQLPENVKVGDQLMASSGEHELTVFVKELTDETAVIDANHPLAGQDMIFDIEIVSIGDGAGDGGSKIIIEP